MSTHVETDTVRAPAHWAPLLFNGDASGMSESDAAECLRFAEALSADGWRVTGTEEVEPWFTASHDFGLACDVFTYELCRNVEGEV